MKGADCSTTQNSFPVKLRKWLIMDLGWMGGTFNPEVLKDRHRPHTSFFSLAVKRSIWSRKKYFAHPSKSTCRISTGVFLWPSKPWLQSKKWLVTIHQPQSMALHWPFKRRKGLKRRTPKAWLSSRNITSTSAADKFGSRWKSCTRLIKTMFRTSLMPSFPDSVSNAPIVPGCCANVQRSSVPCLVSDQIRVGRHNWDSESDLCEWSWLKRRGEGQSYLASTFVNTDKVAHIRRWPFLDQCCHLQITYTTRR